MIEIDGKEYRNLMEQVGKNQEDIEKIKQAMGSALPDPIEGPEGPQGVSVVGATVNADNELILTLSDGTTINAGTIKTLQGPRGLQGKDGPIGKTILNLTEIDSTPYTPTISPAVNEPIDETVETTADVKFGADTQKEIDFKFKYKLPNIAKLVSNPNLLINSNFAIKQRGGDIFNSDTTRVYACDRWFLSGTAGNSFTHSTKTFSVGSSGGYFAQEIENASDLAGKTVTLSVKISSITSDVTRLYAWDGYTNQLLSITGAGTHSKTFTINENCTRLWIGINSQSGHSGDIVIDYMKLEIGEIATPYIPPLIAEELPKCQRYFIMYSLGGSPYYGSINGYVMNSSTSYISIDTPVSMRIKPTFNPSAFGKIVNNGSMVTVVSGTCSHISSNKVVLTLIASGNVLLTDTPCCLVIADFNLDAEIY